MKVLLCGFMGSGKSTLFERIRDSADSLRSNDLDTLVSEEICEKGETLGDAIRRIGFEKFRAVENRILLEELESSGDLLLSLGGGSLNEEVLQIIDKNSEIILVWVNTPFEVCWSRVENDKNRPLVAKGKDFLKELFSKRKPLYSRAKVHLSPEQQSEVLDLQFFSQY